MTEFERFICKVDLDGDCWIWMAGTYPVGYGQFRRSNSGPKTGAHIISYELFIGDIAKGLCVMHSCDNTLCVNPDHLSLGTHTDNMQDMLRKGRNRSKKTYESQYGPRSLSLDEIIDIKDEYKPRKNPIWKIAEKYGTNYSVIQRVLAGSYASERRRD